MSEASLPSDWRVSYRPYLLVDDETWTVVDANYAAEEFWGYSSAQLVALPLARLLDERGVERIVSAATEAKEREFSLLSLTMRQQSTTEHLVDLSAAVDDSTLTPRRWLLGFTEAGRHSVEFELGRIYWAQSAFARSLTALLNAETPASVMSKVCDAIVVQEPYILACVCLKHFDERKSVLIPASSGPAQAYLDGINLSWSEDLVEGCGATGKALREGVPVVVREAMVDPLYAPWKERGRRFDIRASVTVPFKRDNQVVGALLIYANKPNAFGPRELNLFVQLGQEIEFVITLHEDRRNLALALQARRAAEERLEQARAELLRAERNSFVGEFAATLAHEISQPVTSLRANAEANLRWLARPVPNIDEAKSAASRIVSNIDRLQDAITRIKLMYMRDRPAYAKVDIVDACKGVVDIARQRVEECGAKLDESYPPWPLYVCGDRSQLQQVAFNLLSNAIDALEGVEPSSRRLSVRVDLSDSRAACVEIADSGGGIDPDIWPRLFTRFVSSKPKGMGLGLVISKSIIEAHGGEIRASPAQPHGTTIRFTVPAQRENGND
jgi:signal transduction histidine kinase